MFVPILESSCSQQTVSVTVFMVNIHLQDPCWAEVPRKPAAARLRRATDESIAVPTFFQAPNPSLLSESTLHDWNRMAPE